MRSSTRWSSMAPRLVGRPSGSVLGPRQLAQVVAKAATEGGRGAIVVLDQGRPRLAGPAAVGVPGPGEVGDPAGVGPVHVWVDVAVAAVALPQLAGHHRVGLRDFDER